MRIRLPGIAALGLLLIAACAPPAPGEPGGKFESADGPSSGDELENDGVSDIVIPDTSAHESTGSDTERSMFRAARSAPLVAYINRGGGAFRAGQDNAAADTSSILSYYRRGGVNLPASSYDDGAWAQLMSCVKQIYAPFNVTVTDERPGAAGYNEIVVTNAWASSVLGISNSVGGIAPLGQCRVVPQAVGFVFQPTYDRSGFGGVRGTCEAVAHELGHTLSLSHERLPTDLMSYAPASLSKSFQDQPSACGVSASAPEACSCGGQTQDSHDQLVQMVGASNGTTDTTTPSTPPTTSSTISVTAPANGATVAGNGNLTVTVDGGGNGNVRLVWLYNGRVLACDDSIQGVTCTTSGTTSTWTIGVGTGSRSFYAIAQGANGASVASSAVTVSLGGGTTTGTTDSPPSVTTQLPADRSSYAPGQTIVFQASASDDRGLSDVRATWVYNGGSLDYPMAQTTTPGVYQARTTVSASAGTGWRAVDISAADNAGQRSVSTRRYVYIQ